MALNSRNEFPKRLKMMRKEFGFTPREFAKQLNIKLQSYYAYENGRAVPCFDVLTDIAERCNISLDWLCGLTSMHTKEKKEISSVLSQLLSANEMGKQIEVHITCESIAEY